MSDNNSISDTGSGIIVGAEPAQPRRAADWNTQQRPDQAVSQQQPVNVQPNEQRPAYRWTDEDIENARKQEKDKLYGRIEDMSGQLRQLQEAREAEAAERERLAEEAAAATRAREEDELNVRDLLEKRDREFQEALAERDRRYETDREIFARERALQEAELYRRDRIAQEAQDIIPEVRDQITGNTPEEIDQSIEMWKQRSAAIIANMLAAEPPQVPFQPRGAAPTAPPVGPMEQLPDYQQITPDDIRGMDMETYKKYRPQLLQAANPTQQRRG